jgi:hypothetical protein
MSQKYFAVFMVFQFLFVVYSEWKITQYNRD